MVIFQHDILSMILCLHVHSSSPRAETADEKVIKKLSKNVLLGGVIPFFQSVRVHISWSVFGSIKQYLPRLCSWWHLHYAAFEARDSTPQTGFTCVLFCRLVHVVVLQDQSDSSQKAEEEEGLRLHLSGPARRELV